MDTSLTRSNDGKMVALSKKEDKIVEIYMVLKMRAVCFKRTSTAGGWIEADVAAPGQVGPSP